MCLRFQWFSLLKTENVRGICCRVPLAKNLPDPRITASEVAKLALED